MYRTMPLSASLICSQQASQHVPAHAVGCFKLNTGRAMSLRPNVAGELRIAHGQVWVTFSNAADDTSVRAGDHFLKAGDLLHLQPGQQLVMEMVMEMSEKAPQDHVYFSWEPDAALSRAAAPRRVQHARADVRQSLRDLGAGLHQAGWAFGRLVQGLAGNLAYTLMFRRGTS